MWYLRKRFMLNALYFSTWQVCGNLSYQRRNSTYNKNVKSPKWAGDKCALSLLPAWRPLATIVTTTVVPYTKKGSNSRGLNNFTNVHISCLWEPTVKFDSTGTFKPLETHKHLCLYLKKHKHLVVVNCSRHRISKLSGPWTLPQWWKWVHVCEEGASQGGPSLTLTP